MFIDHFLLAIHSNLAYITCILHLYSFFCFQPYCRKGWVLLLLPKTYKVLDAKLVLFCRQGRLERSGESRKVISTTEGRGPSSTTLSSSGVGGIHPLTFTSGCVLHASQALMVEILKDFYLCFSLECDNFEIDDMPEGKLFVLILLQVKSETSLLVNRLKLAATIWLLTHDCI